MRFSPWTTGTSRQVTVVVDGSSMRRPESRRLPFKGDRCLHQGGVVLPAGDPQPGIGHGLFPPRGFDVVPDDDPEHLALAGVPDLEGEGHLAPLLGGIELHVHADGVALVPAGDPPRVVNLAQQLDLVRGVGIAAGLRQPGAVVVEQVGCCRPSSARIPGPRPAATR